MKIPKFIAIQLMITAGLCAIGYFALAGAFESWIRGFICLAVFLSSVAGMISYSITWLGMEKSIRAFSTYLIGGMVLKMFFGIICMTVIALTMKEIAMHFVLAYFFSYIVFISFEVFALMTKLRPFSKKAERISDEDSGKK